MAVPPTIPTSFVPKQPVKTSAARPVRPRSGGILFIFSIIVFLAVLVSAAGVFAYGMYMEQVRDAKAAELEEARARISEETVEDFVKLRDRMLAGRTLLSAHTRPSAFFDLLEQKTLRNVRFESLELSVSEDRAAAVELTGVARNFNALAAQSSLFATERLLRRAIFADISVNEDGTVGFHVTAELDPRLTVSAPSVGAAEGESPLPTL